MTILRRPSPIILALNGFMLLFALSAVISLRASYDPARSREPIYAILACVVLYLIVAYAARPRWLSRIVAALGMLAATGFAGYFITQFGHQDYPETPGFIQRLGELTTFGPRLDLLYIHPNAAATFLEVALPICMALAISTRGMGRRFWGLCMLAMLYAILLTFSRGAYVGLAGTLVIALIVSILKQVNRKQAMILGGLFAFIGLVAVIGVLVVVPRVPALASTLLTAESRLTLYRNSLFLARDYAITGIGLGDTFAMVYSRFGLLIFVPFLSYSHNLPLAVWLGQGILGIVAFIGIVVLFYTFVIRVMIAAKPGALFYGSWFGVTATLLHGLTDARQYTESPWIMPTLFFGIGLAVACGARSMKRLDREYTEANLPLPARSYRLPIALAGAAVVLLVGGLVIFNRSITATWYANQGALEETRADSFIIENMDEAERQSLQESAVSWYQRALEIDPNQPTANRRLGNLLVSLERFDEAVPYLETAVSKEPGNPAAIKGLGLAYVWVGRTQEAADTFLMLDDTTAMAQELFTWGQFRTSEDENKPLLGAYAWESALLMRPADPDPNLDVWLLVGDTFREGGDLTRARDWYNRVLTRDPENERATTALAQLGA